MTSPSNPQFGKKSAVILQRQTESLEILAGRVGISRQALETRTVNDSCWSIDQTIEQTQRVVDAFGSFAGISFDTLKSKLEQKKGRDFWDDLASIEQAIHSLAIEYIARKAQHLPIEWSYLLNFAKKHRLPEPTPDHKGMTSFLRSIPSAYIFDHEFNAFLEWNIEGSLPCIFYDTLLINSLSEVALLLSLYGEISTSKEQKKAYRKNDSALLFEQANLLVDKLLGRELLVRGEIVAEGTPEMFLGRIGMQVASHLFVLSHEIGHLLLGHMKRSRSSKLEYEADAFATLVVGSSGWINKEFAITAVFALMDIVEAERPSSSSHPSSFNRFQNVIAQTKEMKAEIDWDYVGNLLKTILDKAAESRVGRRVFEDIS